MKSEHWTKFLEKISQIFKMLLINNEVMRFQPERIRIFILFYSYFADKSFAPANFTTTNCPLRHIIRGKLSDGKLSAVNYCIMIIDIFEVKLS